MKHLQFHFFVAFAVSLTLLQGCGVLVGNVKPLSERSEGYKVEDLSQADKNWVKIKSQDSNSEDDPETVSGVSDAAYQSKTTSSVISINSACRGEGDKQHTSLREFSNLLFLGMTEIKDREEIVKEIQGVPALQTTLKGNMNGQKVTVRAVVLRKKTCIYDLMYIAQPDKFSTQESVFSRFVDSLRLY